MADNRSHSGYAGDLTAAEAWQLILSDRGAQLVDVRTVPEWNFVGVPDLSGAGREVHLVSWQHFPSMAVEPAFVEKAARSLRETGATAETPVLFICRSGARSRAAAVAMTEAGFGRAYNVEGGFEGDLDENSHRGSRSGWKASNLPWRQT